MSDLDTNIGLRNADYCATLVDEWVRCGVTHAVVAPGSRSTPLALALWRDARVDTAVVLDERSAAFLALGIARVSGRPTVVVCTSGSAAAHFHPAVVEADHGDIPLIVCTADRPPELHDTGAGQTIDQHDLYGTALRWRCVPGPPEPLPAYWRSFAARSVHAATGPRPGPVHLDLAFREPLAADRPGVPCGAPGPDLVGSTRVVAPDALAECAAQCHSTARGLIVVGWGNALSSAALDALAEASGWPVLADAISNRRDHADRVRAYEALVRHTPFADAHRPDLVVRFGAPLTSKIVTQWLDASVAQIVVDPHDRRLDPHRAAATVVVADDDRFALDLSAAVAALGGASDAGAWSRSWRQADADAARALDGVLDLHPTSGAAVVRTVAATAPADAHLLVASSMAVRDLEWFSAPRSDITVHANRGANGIDGLVATALGIAHASARTTIAVLGDLAFLHDAASLHAAPHGTNAVVVVVDNSGGGIFSFLPQADLCDADEFEALFGTPQSVDLVAVAQAHGARARRVDAADLEATLADAARTPGLDVLVVPALGRADDVVVHRAAWAAAADELR